MASESRPFDKNKKSILERETRPIDRICPFDYVNYAAPSSISRLAFPIASVKGFALMIRLRPISFFVGEDVTHQ